MTTTTTLIYSSAMIETYDIRDGDGQLVGSIFYVRADGTWRCGDDSFDTMADAHKHCVATKLAAA